MPGGACAERSGARVTLARRRRRWGEMRAAGPGPGPWLLLLLALAAAPGGGSAEQGALPAKRLRMAYATGPLLKFQIW